MDITDKARAFLADHQADGLLVLPTVWDAWSAEAVVDAGFRAVAVGSQPVARSRGGGDQEAMGLDEALSAVASICRAVDVPVNADLESGYGVDPAQLVERVLEAGAVGLDVEDTAHGEDGRMRSSTEQSDYVAGLRAAADRAGVDLVVTARTDVYQRPAGTFADPAGEAVRRLTAYAEAGASCVYAFRTPSNPGVLQDIVASVPVPVSVRSHPVEGTAVGGVDVLRSLGVRRVTFGPLLQQSLTPLIQDVLAPWH